MKVDVPDNGPNIESLEGKPHGVLPLLDEQCRLGERATDTAFSENVNNNGGCRAGRRARPARQDAVRRREGIHREALVHRRRHLQHLHQLHHLRLTSASPPPSVVQPVEYAALDFLDKNRDTFFPDLTSCAASSEVALMQTLFPQSEADDADATHSGTGRSYASVSHKYTHTHSAQLAELGATAASFIRTIKPNDALAPGTFDAERAHAAADVRDGAGGEDDARNVPEPHRPRRHRRRRRLQVRRPGQRRSTATARLRPASTTIKATRGSSSRPARRSSSTSSAARRPRAPRRDGGIVLNWKLGQWQREYRAAQMVRAWCTAPQGDGTPGADGGAGARVPPRAPRVRDRAGGEAARRMQKHARMLVEGKAFRRRKAAVLLMQTRSRGRAAR